MRKLLNTLYILTPDLYLSKDGENIVIKDNDEKKGRFPIHILENIVCGTDTGMSPKLMELCVKNQVGVNFMSRTGRLQAKLYGPVRGNVLLRRSQFRLADDEKGSLELAKLFIMAKMHNQRRVLTRTLSDHGSKINSKVLDQAIAFLKDSISEAKSADSAQTLLGVEGVAAKQYFSVFNESILFQKNDFQMFGRNRRPSLDPVNALLSFAYGLLRIDLENALETVGLDPYVGFFHTDRPGRASLALDMMEELRPYIGDRFVLSLINRKQIQGKHFFKQSNGAVLLTDDGSQVFLKVWNQRKQELMTHPFLDEKIEVGLLPYAQAMLMARFIRGDLELYPPFFFN